MKGINQSSTDFCTNYMVHMYMSLFEYRGKNGGNRWLWSTWGVSQPPLWVHCPSQALVILQAHPTSNVNHWIKVVFSMDDLR